MFVRMQSSYGHRFSSLYSGPDGERMLGAAKSEWCRGIKGYPVAIIKIAFEVAIAHYDKFPPTLPEFRAICSETKSRRDQLSDTRLRLENQVQAVTQERKRYHIANMRCAIAGASKQQPVARGRK